MKKLSVIKRICRMERYFDEVSFALSKQVESKTVMRKANMLGKYMQSGLWLKDFERDERGKLPASLKRGVLSEDGLYDLLREVRMQRCKKAKR